MTMSDPIADMLTRIRNAIGSLIVILKMPPFLNSIYLPPPGLTNYAVRRCNEPSAYQLAFLTPGI